MISRRPGIGSNRNVVDSELCIHRCIGPGEKLETNVIPGHNLEYATTVSSIYTQNHLGIATQN